MSGEERDTRAKVEHSNVADVKEVEIDELEAMSEVESQRVKDEQLKIVKDKQLKIVKDEQLKIEKNKQLKIVKGEQLKIMEGSNHLPYHNCCQFWVKCRDIYYYERERLRRMMPDSKADENAQRLSLQWAEEAFKKIVDEEKRQN